MLFTIRAWILQRPHLLFSDSRKPVSRMSRSENTVGEKWDRCLTDSGIKTASGLGLGIVASLLLFKRKSWPIIFGTGAGFGENVFPTASMEFRVSGVC